MQKKSHSIKLERKSFIKKFTGLEANYEFDPKPIGKGAYGEVYVCRHRTTKDVRAVKVVKKAKIIDIAHLLHEIDMLKSLVTAFLFFFLGSSKYHSNF